jgi:protein CMS1
MSDSDSPSHGVPLIEDLSDDSATKTPKRKREDGENDAPTESKRAAKRRKNPKKPKDVDDSALDLERGVNNAIAHMDSRLMADHIAQRTKRFRPDVSLVEADDLAVSGKTILRSTVVMDSD